MIQILKQMSTHIQGKRNTAIDLIRFIAALLITNSHMDILYPERFGFLATGGAIGDALFFFCSGFTLFLKPIGGIKDFPNWYKRRINRIYPTVFAVAIIGCLFFGSHKDIVSIIIHSGWFVTYIMIYYVIIYFIGAYCKNKMIYITCLIAIATTVWYFFVYDSPGFSMYSLGTSSICLLFFFIFMLMGAQMGVETQKNTSKSILDIILLFVSVLVYYALIIFGGKNNPSVLPLLSIIPLVTMVYYLYKVGMSKWIQKLYNNRIVVFIVRFVGSLCLEIYLVQRYVFTDKLNRYFPLNIVLVFLGVILLAYLTRCLARFLSQTFKDEPYQWKDIVKMY